MLIFLFVLSIVVNLIAILSILLLYLRQNKLIYKEEKHQQALEEMEQTLSSYLYEIKEDNKAFLKKFQLIKQEKLPAANEPDVVDSSVSQEEAASAPLIKATRFIAASRYKTAGPATSKPPESPSDQAVRLFSEGKSVAEIAKKLNKGMTEIELMVKFHNKTE
ncbi:DUF6115 domain-containing protein [Jeotgalibacillus proteolyticus]|uniref:Swarming motility protein SwrB n=1 Tax=Jeotgalibacillus proteolyticus TaxID=2082395 RepID=A0A2S5GGE4_9BACL|nr:hypothetical protein [Jeotgalibacillus proteolyticus]PPA72038.1 hypothetical protein C4B60_01255 [Jeotgalibacillus proteolyticus]